MQHAPFRFAALLALASLTLSGCAPAAPASSASAHAAAAHASASTPSPSTASDKLEKVVYTYKISGQAKATFSWSRVSDGTSTHTKQVALPYTTSETRLWDPKQKVWVQTPTMFTTISAQQSDPAKPLVCDQYWKGKLVSHHFVLNYKNGSLKQGVACG